MNPEIYFMTRAWGRGQISPLYFWFGYNGAQSPLPLILLNGIQLREKTRPHILELQSFSSTHHAGTVRLNDKMISTCASRDVQIRQQCQETYRNVSVQRIERENLILKNVGINPNGFFRSRVIEASNLFDGFVFCQEQRFDPPFLHGHY